MAKKLISLILAMVLCFGVLAACNGNSGDEPFVPIDPNTGEYVTPNLNGAKVQIYTSPIASTTKINDNYTTKLVEKTLNMDLEYMEIDSFGNAYETLVKDIPDITYFTGYNASYTGYGDDGAYINILEYLDYMPNVKAFYEEYKDSGIFDKYIVRDGVMYALPVLITGSAANYVYLYREDIFKENNLTWPTNQADFEATLRTLKEKYPSSYPFVMRNLTGSMSGATTWSYLWGTPIVTYSSYSTLFTLRDDGTYELGWIGDGMKEMAQYMQKLTKEGLMHPSSFGMDANGWTAAIGAGDSFITFDKVDRIPTLNAAGRGVKEDFNMVAGAPFNMGTYATKTNVVSTSFSNPTTSAIHIIGDNANKANSIAYIDWLYSEEGIELTNWGVKGESYDVDENGKKYLIESWYKNYSALIECGLEQLISTGVQDFDVYIATCDESLAESLRISLEYTGKSAYQYPLKYTEEEQMIWDTYVKSTTSFIRGEWAKFAIGKEDGYTFDNWGRMLEDLKKSYGYDLVLKMHQDALARMKANG